ncbi:serine/threonine-protein kinase [Renibacterium salmoninarum]|nr:serine/threonine-protein kinase [Renibacterium salmoninarum]
MDRDCSDVAPDRVLLTRYRLAERIGIGACAAVFRAEDLRLSRPVAVKVFSAGPTSWESELAILARLQHPFLVTILDCGVWAEELSAPRPFMVMEYVAGSDLRAMIAKHSTGMPLAKVARLGWVLAQALETVHANSVVHRDVKPANILIDTSGLPKLCDFGVSRLHDSAEATIPGITIGTASYLSPEQALGEPVHASADIYSLGLVLLECLTGVKAFPGSALEASIARLLRDPVIPEWLGSEWSQLVTAMTDRVAADRPTATECTEALFELQLRQAAHAA